eukprot:16198195-Heterocapsa_arctica.AAC.1
MPEVDAARFTTYALRRFLPSVAEALGMAMEKRNSLGIWVDNVADNTRQRASEPMGVRYSAARLMSAAQVKRACLAALAHLRRIEPEARLERLAW